MFQEGKKEMGGNGTAFTHIDFLKILEEKSAALHKLHRGYHMIEVFHSSCALVVTCLFSCARVIRVSTQC